MGKWVKWVASKYGTMGRNHQVLELSQLGGRRSVESSENGGNQQNMEHLRRSLCEWMGWFLKYGLKPIVGLWVKWAA